MRRPLDHLTSNQLLKGLGTLLIAVLVVVVSNAVALAQGNTCPGCSEPNTNLFPQGFGPHTYTRWKPYQGVIDSTCPDYPNPAPTTVTQPCNFTALYMQNMSDMNDPAAAVAAIEGFDNQPTTALQQLQFDRRIDGGCTATSPRFSIRTKSPDMKYSIGCATMTLSAAFSAVDGKGNTNAWETRTADSILIAASTVTGGTIISLAIIYDDGAKLGIPGFVFLDNIEVCATNLSTSTGCKLWTQPSDNSEK